MKKEVKSNNPTPAKKRVRPTDPSELWEEDRISLDEFLRLSYAYPGGSRSWFMGELYRDLERSKIMKCYEYGLYMGHVRDALGHGELTDIEEAQTELSLELISHFLHRKELEAKRVPPSLVGKRIRDPLIRDLAVSMLDTCAEFDVVPGQALCNLHRALHALTGIPRQRTKDLGKMRGAAKAIAENPDISDREVAGNVGISHTTIGRWKKDSVEFQNMIKVFGNEETLESLIKRLVEEQLR